MENKESEYVELIKSSNLNHNAVFDYIEKHGVDEKFVVFLQGKYRWLKYFAKKHSIELTE